MGERGCVWGKGGGGVDREGIERERGCVNRGDKGESRVKEGVTLLYEWCFFLL